MLKISKPVVLAAFLVVLSGCYFWNDRGVEGAASNMVRSRLKFPDSYEGSGNVIWRGEKDGLKSFVVKVEYETKNSRGLMVPDCELVSFIRGKDARLNMVNSPAKCEELDCSNIGGCPGMGHLSAVINKLGDKLAWYVFLP